MRQYLNLTVILLLVGFFNPLCSQSSSRPIYVIVHGAYGGGWAFKSVDSMLVDKGCKVYRPTLTGQGERAHLSSPDIGLDIHINDIVNVILFEDIHDIILVGHSYGGMVVTGVADRIPERIKKLIYLDAFVPENGESASEFWGPRKDYVEQHAVDGYLLPYWVREDQPVPKDVPHSLKTLLDQITLTNPLRLEIPTSYILTVAKGQKAGKDDFASHSKRARNKGWPVEILEADHNPQWSTPEALVEMLFNQ